MTDPASREGEGSAASPNRGLGALAACLLGLLASAALAAPAARADADPGDLDTSFGSGGIVATAFTSFGGAFATDVAVRGNRIAAVGGDGGGRFALGIYNLDGSQPSFGRATTNFGADDRANAVAFTPLGKIVAVGFSDPSGSFNSRFAIARYFSFGTLDSSFDGDGKVTTAIDHGARAHDVALQADEKIVAAGELRDSNVVGSARDLEFAVVRYNADGSLDTSFDGNGIRAVDFDDNDETKSDSDVANAVAIQPDGRIVAVGFQDLDAVKFALIRLNADGSLDTSFDGDGKLTTAFSNLDARARSVALQPDGKIVVAGNAGGAIALARYNPNGSLDTGFGGDGRVTIVGPPGSDRAEAVAIQDDGKIVVAGRTASGAGNVVIARFLANGSVDQTFGIVTTGLGGDESARGIAIQDDGRIVIAGETSTQDGRFLLARYHAEPFDDTPPDTSISGPSGTISDPEPSFELASTEPGSTFECELDGAGFEPCTSPHTVGPLAAGAHTLRARATDEAGNTDPTPAERPFTIDTSRPSGGAPDTNVAIRIPGKVLRLKPKRRRVVARLACPASEASPPCQGRVVVKTRPKIRFVGNRRRVKLAAGRYSIDAGERRRVRLRIAGKERRKVRIVRLLRNRKPARRVRTIARVRDQAGNSARRTKRMRVRVG